MLAATDALFPKHWFLHLPTRPDVTDGETVRVPGHVSEFQGTPLTAYTGHFTIDTTRSGARPCSEPIGSRSYRNSAS